MIAPTHVKEAVMEPQMETAAVERVLAEDARVEPPDWVRQRANLRDPEAEFARALADPEGFWGEAAADFQWATPWQRVRAGVAPDQRWFEGATLNITVNALDRHAVGPRAN